MNNKEKGQSGDVISNIFLDLARSCKTNHNLEKYVLYINFCNPQYSFPLNIKKPQRLKRFISNLIIQEPLEKKKVNYFTLIIEYVNVN